MKFKDKVHAQKVIMDAFLYLVNINPEEAIGLLDSVKYTYYWRATKGKK